MSAEAALILRSQLLPPNSPTRRRQNGDSKKKVKLEHPLERRDDEAQAGVAFALDWHAP
jgi:hypothetical protein